MIGKISSSLFTLDESALFPLLLVGYYYHYSSSSSSSGGGGGGGGSSSSSGSSLMCPIQILSRKNKYSYTC